MNASVMMLILVFAVVACVEDKPPKRQYASTAPAAGEEPAADAGATDGGAGDGVQPLGDDEAIAFLKDKCAACHNPKDGSVRSFWEIDVATFDKQQLATSTMAPVVYWTLLAKSKDIIGGKPAAMPPMPLSVEMTTTVQRLVKWMERELPGVAAEGYARYGNGVADQQEGVGVILNYKCSQPATVREYVRRFTNDAFGREPTAAELKLGEHGPESVVTAADREKIASRIVDGGEWKAEFVEKGLKKFAAKLSGANDIQMQTGMLTQAQADALKAEFYQQLKKAWEGTSYKDILLSDKVMVNAQSAALYGCTAPTNADEWAECQMQAPRGSYFTTLGYLRSKPSSFLRDNNNYGRAALMHFIVRGDVFKAAFDQGGSEESVKPVPSCLKSRDLRGKRNGNAFSAIGSTIIPKTANLCQSCHIDRQMAAGSILFRPYNIAGLLYGSSLPINTDPDFAAATGSDMLSKDGEVEIPVDEAFLQALLDGGPSEKACIPASAGQADMPLTTVKDLANYLIGDGRVLAGGLARHLPRAMSNLDNTSEEIIVKVNKAFNDGGGKLPAIFKAYFGSETYACKK